MDLYDFVSAQPLILVEPDIPLLIDGLDIQNMCLSTIYTEQASVPILFESCSGNDFAVTKIEFLDHATKPWYVRVSFTTSARADSSPLRLMVAGCVSQLGRSMS